MFPDYLSSLTVGAIILGSIALLMIMLSRFRIVVSTNDVHIVQHAGKTVTYGKDQSGGNVYYHWPAWVPHMGVVVTSLPSSVFQLKLADYPAYDKGRVPFQLDVLGFFRILDYSTAASRVSDMKDLHDQLDGILKGAMRAILASYDIEEILEGRSKFGEHFTEAVNSQLESWGATTVKAIELMDIRDMDGSQVIRNIMAKKTSLIQMQSRTEVANNTRQAEIAEIEAKQAVDLRAREQEETVGKRAAQRDQAIALQQQEAEQAVAAAKALTAGKEQDIARVNQVRAAEIAREAQLVVADQARQVAVINADAAKQKLLIDADADRQRSILEAEGSKQNTILVAEGELEQQTMQAKAKQLVGDAEGQAETARLMAPVNSQIALAKEIGSNDNYQNYLLTLRQIEASQAVGKAAADALAEADIKIMSTTGTPMDGIKSVMDVLTPKGAMQIGAALEAVGQTPIGAKLASVLRGKANGAEPPHA